MGMGASDTAAARQLAAPPAAADEAPPSFAEVYQRGFDYVWRSLRALGVRDSRIEDAVQDVFVVVARRLPEFAGRSSIETWLFAIARRVAQRHRRTESRHEGRSEALPEDLVDTSRPGPRAAAETSEATRLLLSLLDQLDDDKRALFVLVEIEQKSVPVAAEALGIKLNTAYSRLRLARQRFEAALARHNEGELP